MTLTVELKEHALALGLAAVGVAPAEALAAGWDNLARRRAAGRCCGLEPRGTQDLLLPGVRAVIVGAICYLAEEPLLPPDGPRGLVARAGRGRDYHLVLAEKLAALGEWLRRRVPGLAYRVLVDTGPLLERELAVSAGIGRVGKNGLLFVPSCGSWVFLGELLVNVELEYDRPLGGDPCGQCRRCLLACPAGALGETPADFHAGRCLSFLTQQRGFLPREVRPLLGDRLYGCDRCQEVCPLNRTVKPGKWPEPHLGGGGRPLLEQALSLTGSAAREFWGRSAATWRGVNLLRRNAAVAAGNSGDLRAVPWLIEALADPSAQVRGHAAWALGKLGGPEARAALGRALDREEDPRVLAEFKAALSAGEP